MLVSGRVVPLGSELGVAMAATVSTPPPVPKYLGGNSGTLSTRFIYIYIYEVVCTMSVCVLILQIHIH